MKALRIGAIFIVFVTQLVVGESKTPQNAATLLRGQYQPLLVVRSQQHNVRDGPRSSERRTRPETLSLRKRKRPDAFRPSFVVFD